MKITKRVKLLAIALLMALGLGGGAIGITYAATNNKAQASDLETNDDNAKSGKTAKDTDTETNDDNTKSSTTSAATNVQDNGQDGETNDSPNQ